MLTMITTIALNLFLVHALSGAGLDKSHRGFDAYLQVHHHGNDYNRGNRQPQTPWLG
ncbi:MAG: hypothetical protein AAF572_00570 [Cyanobacteria bacterium P01_B01_bin.77]